MPVTDCQAKTAGLQDRISGLLFAKGNATGGKKEGALNRQRQGIAFSRLKTEKKGGSPAGEFLCLVAGGDMAFHLTILRLHCQVAVFFCWGFESLSAVEER